MTKLTPRTHNHIKQHINISAYQHINISTYHRFPTISNHKIPLYRIIIMTDKQKFSKEAEQFINQCGDEKPELPKCAFIKSIEIVKMKDIPNLSDKRNVIYTDLFYGPLMCMKLKEPWDIYCNLIGDIRVIVADDFEHNLSEECDEFSPGTNPEHAILQHNEEKKRISKIAYVGKQFDSIKTIYILVNMSVSNETLYVKFDLRVDLSYYMLVFLWVYAQQYAFINGHAEFSWDHLFSGSYSERHILGDSCKTTMVVDFITTS